MKLVVAVVVLFVGGFLAINYGSNYMMGGIEAGLPGGGDGKFADYHKDNKVTTYFETRRDNREKTNYMPGKNSTFSFGGSSTTNGYQAAPAAEPGEISSNPFAK